MRARSLISAIIVVGLGVLTGLGAATVAAGHAPTLVVNSVDDNRVDRCTPGHCNLREAILAANAAGGGLIRFELPAYPYRIQLESALPALNDYVVLDGSTQPGAACPMPIVQLDGSTIPANEPVNGLELFGNHNEVRGLIITNFSGHGAIVDGDENSLQCLFVGVGSTGTQPRGNDGHGIAVVGGHSNRVGGPSFEDANLLSDNGGYGLYVEDALNTYRAWNGVGVDILGNPKLPNGNDALTVNEPPQPYLLDMRTRRQLLRVVEQRVRLIIREHASAIEDSRLFDTYAALIEPPAGAPEPEDLSELVALLRRDPELYGGFTQDAEAVVADARFEAAAELADLVATLQKVLPAFGRDAPESGFDRRDVLGETLSEFSEGDYALSGPPSEVVALQGAPVPIGFPLLEWHSLSTYGPAGFLAEIDDLPFTTTCVGTFVLCVWPVAYHLFPFSAQLLWESSALTQQELSDIVQENGYFLTLHVNGQLLFGGPPPGSPVDPVVEFLQGYYAATVPGDPCPSGKLCLAANVLVRKVLADVPLPWTFELEVMALTELPTPIPGGIDEHGNVILITHEANSIVHESRVILPNGTSSLDWFTEALFPTFQHPRCSDCHGFGTFDAIAAHHGLPTSSFINDTDLHLEPSAYVPGAHVMACVSCHYVPLTDNHGHPFHETEWIAPFQDLDVNWALENSAAICTRVKSNLPTKQLRHEHFHGDGRLFWAIEAPHIMGFTLSPAPPFDFDEFLRRVDLWNYLGAPCP